MQLTTFFSVLLLSLLQLWPAANTSTAPYQERTIIADYVGTWVGHTALGEFKIVLEERKNYRMANGRDYDIIVGRHSYTTQGVTSKNESLSKPVGKFILTGGPDYEHPGQLFVVFTDEVNHKVVYVKLSFVDNNKTKLLWVVTRETETVNTNPAIKVLPGVSVPTNLILTKVK